jgi:hypothetical protein
VQLDLTLYRNQIQNYIYQQPRPDAPVLTVRGAFPLIEYTATDARLQELIFPPRCVQLTHWRINFVTLVLRARNLRTADWLIWMPLTAYRMS